MPPKNFRCCILQITFVLSVLSTKQDTATVASCVPSARKVKIEALSGQYIQLFSLQVFSSSTGSNLATGKTSSQSTTLEASTPASEAINGSDEYSFSHTRKDDTNAWWEVDLGSVLPVRTIYIGQHKCRYAPDPTWCFCHLGGANFTLIDDAEVIVASYSLDLVCAKRHLIEFDSVEYCESTASPSNSPTIFSPSASPSVEGCPDIFVAGTSYEEGDTVEMNGVVYRCKSWPGSQWCSVSGYEPGGDNSAQAWDIIGYCDGSIAPTILPSTPSDAAGCPVAYSSNGNYGAGDKVSVASGAGNAVVYECAQPPNDVYCNQYEPGQFSNLGWAVTGYCDGTIAPTSKSLSSDGPSISPSPFYLNSPSKEPTISPSNSPMIFSPSASPSEAGPN
ncbi:hypothetical protein ACHAXN_008867 [Cyclotella atomus]|jgi:hypothetical protein